MKANTKLLLAVVFGLLAAVLIVLVRKVDVAPIGAAGTEIGLSGLNKAVFDLFGVNLFWYELTQGLGYAALALAGLFAVFGFAQLIRRKSLRRVDPEIYALAGLYIAVIGLYALFEKVIVNYRPILMPGSAEAEASFPSSHTMLICTVFGSTILVLGRYLKNDGLRKALQALCALVVAVTVVGRLICGVHWCTDILGGILISAVLLFLFSWARDRLCAALAPDRQAK